MADKPVSELLTTLAPPSHHAALFAAYDAAGDTHRLVQLVERRDLAADASDLAKQHRDPGVAAAWISRHAETDDDIAFVAERVPADKVLRAAVEHDACPAALYELAAGRKHDMLARIVATSATAPVTAKRTAFLRLVERWHALPAAFREEAAGAFRRARWLDGIDICAIGPCTPAWIVANATSRPLREADIEHLLAVADQRLARGEASAWTNRLAEPLGLERFDEQLRRRLAEKVKAQTKASWLTRDRAVESLIAGPQLPEPERTVDELAAAVRGLGDEVVGDVVSKLVDHPDLRFEHLAGLDMSNYCFGRLLKRLDDFTVDEQEQLLHQLIDGAQNVWVKEHIAPFRGDRVAVAQHLAASPAAATSVLRTLREQDWWTPRIVDGVSTTAIGHDPVVDEAVVTRFLDTFGPDTRAESLFDSVAAAAPTIGELFTMVERLVATQ